MLCCVYSLHVLQSSDLTQGQNTVGCPSRLSGDIGEEVPSPVCGLLRLWFGGSVHHSVSPLQVCGGLEKPRSTVLKILSLTLVRKKKKKKMVFLDKV